MKSKGIDFGSLKIIQIKKGVACTSGTGVPQEAVFTLDQQFHLGSNGLERCVLSFIPVLPAASFPITLSKTIDQMSLAQLIASVTVSLSDSSPPVKGGRAKRQIIDGIDGPTALHVLGWNSDAPVVLGAGITNVLGGPTGVDVTADESDIASALRSVLTSSAWLQMLGPHGDADTGGATFNSAVEIGLPVGMKYGESLEKMAIPFRWFNGAKGESCGGVAGEIKITLGTTVDNAAVTWGNSATMDLYALVLELPGADLPAPPVIQLSRYSTAESTIKIDPGTLVYYAFQKQLSSAGAMQTHSYSDVNLRCGDRDLIYNVVDVHLLGMGMRQASRPGFRVARAELDFTSAVARQATRLARWGVPLVAHDGSLLTAPGSDQVGMCVQINTTGESSHKVVELRYSLNSEGVREAVKDVGQNCDAPNVEVRPATRNGNKVGAALSQILPARRISPPTRA